MSLLLPEGFVSQNLDGLASSFQITYKVLIFVSSVVSSTIELWFEVDNDIFFHLVHKALQ